MIFPSETAGHSPYRTMGMAGMPSGGCSSSRGRSPGMCHRDSSYMNLLMGHQYSKENHAPTGTGNLPLSKRTGMDDSTIRQIEDRQARVQQCFGGSIHDIITMTGDMDEVKIKPRVSQIHEYNTSKNWLISDVEPFMAPAEIPRRKKSISVPPQRSSLNFKSTDRYPIAPKDLRDRATHLNTFDRIFSACPATPPRHLHGPVAGYMKERYNNSRVFSHRMFNNETNKFENINPNDDAMFSPFKLEDVPHIATLQSLQDQQVRDTHQAALELRGFRTRLAPNEEQPQEYTAPLLGFGKPSIFLGGSHKVWQPDHWRQAMIQRQHRGSASHSAPSSPAYREGFLEFSSPKKHFRELTLGVASGEETKAAISGDWSKLPPLPFRAQRSSRRVAGVTNVDPFNGHRRLTSDGEVMESNNINHAASKPFETPSPSPLRGRSPARPQLKSPWAAEAQEELNGQFISSYMSAFSPAPRNQRSLSRRREEKIQSQNSSFDYNHNQQLNNGGGLGEERNVNIKGITNSSPSHRIDEAQHVNPSDLDERASYTSQSHHSRRNSNEARLPPKPPLPSSQSNDRGQYHQVRPDHSVNSDTNDCLTASVLNREAINYSVLPDGRDDGDHHNQHVDNNVNEGDSGSSQSPSNKKSHSSNLNQFSQHSKTNFDPFRQQAKLISESKDNFKDPAKIPLLSSNASDAARLYLQTLKMRPVSAPSIDRIAPEALPSRIGAPFVMNDEQQTAILPPQTIYRPALRRYGGENFTSAHNSIAGGVITKAVDNEAYRSINSLHHDNQKRHFIFPTTSAAEVALISKQNTSSVDFSHHHSSDNSTVWPAGKASNGPTAIPYPSRIFPSTNIAEFETNQNMLRNTDGRIVNSASPAFIPRVQFISSPRERLLHRLENTPNVNAETRCVGVAQIIKLADGSSPGVYDGMTSVPLNSVTNGKPHSLVNPNPSPLDFESDLHARLMQEKPDYDHFLPAPSYHNAGTTLNPSLPSPTRFEAQQSKYKSTRLVKNTTVISAKQNSKSAGDSGDVQLDNSRPPSSNHHAPLPLFAGYAGKSSLSSGKGITLGNHNAMDAVESYVLIPTIPDSTTKTKIEKVAAKHVSALLNGKISLTSKDAQWLMNSSAANVASSLLNPESGAESYSNHHNNSISLLPPRPRSSTSVHNSVVQNSQRNTSQQLNNSAALMESTSVSNSTIEIDNSSIPGSIKHQKTNSTSNIGGKLERRSYTLPSASEALLKSTSSVRKATDHSSEKLHDNNHQELNTMNHRRRSSLNSKSSSMNRRIQQ